MAKSIFDDRKIDVPCPQCRHKNSKALGWLRNNTKLVCGGCNVAITLDNEKLVSGLDEADKAMEGFRRTIANFGKK